MDTVCIQVQCPKDAQRTQTNFDIFQLTLKTAKAADKVFQSERNFNFEVIPKQDLIFKANIFNTRFQDVRSIQSKGTMIRVKAFIVWILFKPCVSSNSNGNLRARVTYSGICTTTIHLGCYQPEVNFLLLQKLHLYCSIWKMTRAIVTIHMHILN